MNFEHIVHNEEEMLVIGKKIAGAIASGDKIALQGTLGAGKTTLARGLLTGLGFVEEVPSPTFAIIQSYAPPETRIALYHADLYRIEDPNEIEELGLSDILYEGALVAEWPERMPDSYWVDGLHLTIEIIENDKRKLIARCNERWSTLWSQL